MVLETSQERVMFLKLGFIGTEIEQRYLLWNNIIKTNFSKLNYPFNEDIIEITI